MFTGTLAATPLPEVLRKLAEDRFTGELSIHGSGTLSRIYVRDGSPVYVELPEPADLLGQILVASGRLAESDLRQCLATALRPGQRFGDVLLSRGMIDEASLKQALREQVRLRLMRLYAVVQGDYAFAAIPGAHNRGMQGSSSLGIRIPEPGDNTSLMGPVSAKGPRSGVMRPITPPRSTPLMTPQRPATPSGTQPRIPTPTPTPAPRTGSQPVVNLPSSLPSSRRPLSDPGKQAPTVPPEERAILVLDIEKRSKVIEGETYFSVLGVPETAEVEEIRAQAAVLGKRYNANRVAVLGMANLREPAEKIYKAIQKAFATLSDPDKRKEYEIELARLRTEIAFKEKLLEIEKALADLANARGQVYLRRRDYAAAAAELTTAAKKDPDQAMYVGTAAYCRFCAGQVDANEAIKDVSKAVRMAPKQGRLRYYAGVLLRQSEQLERALFSFNKAKELDPSIEEVDSEIRLLIARGVKVAKDWESWEKDVGKKGPEAPGSDKGKADAKGDPKADPKADKGKAEADKAKAGGKGADKSEKGGFLSKLMNLEIGGSKKK